MIQIQDVPDIKSARRELDRTVTRTFSLERFIMSDDPHPWQGDHPCQGDLATLGDNKLAQELVVGNHQALAILVDRYQRRSRPGRLSNLLPRGYLRGFAFAPDGKSFYYVHR